jgi:hypothetical protein
MAAFSNVVVNTTGTGSAPAGTITATGTITGGNINTAGDVSVTGNVTSRNLVAMANVQAGNLRTTGLISSTGNVTGGNLFTVGSVSAQNTIFGPSASITGAITAGTLNVGTLTLASVSTAGNVTGGNLLTGGSISATGNIQANGNVSASNFNTFNANGVINGGSLNVLGSIRGASLSVSGNIIGGAFLNPNGTPYQSPGGPAFISFITTPTSIPVSPNLPVTEFQLIFNSISNNTGGGYNPVTGIFIAPRAGFYQVSAAFAPGVPFPPPSIAGLYGACVIGIYKNNVAIAAGPFVEAKGRSWGSFTAWAIDASSISTLVYLNLGDNLRCKVGYVTNYSGFTTLPNLVPNYFQACWLRS